MQLFFGKYSLSLIMPIAYMMQKVFQLYSKYIPYNILRTAPNLINHTLMHNYINFLAIVK